MLCKLSEMKKMRQKENGNLKAIEVIKQSTNLRNSFSLESSIYPISSSRWDKKSLQDRSIKYVKISLLLYFPYLYCCLLAIYINHLNSIN